MLYHIILYHIMSYHIISYRIILHQIILYHITSYYIISYYTTSNHIISYERIRINCRIFFCGKMSLLFFDCRDGIPPHKTRLKNQELLWN